MFYHKVMTKYGLNQRTFSDANYISSSVLDAEYAKSKETRPLFSRILQSNGEDRHQESTLKGYR